MIRPSIMACMLIASAANAQTLRYNYTLSTAIPYDWETIDPVYGEWINSGEIYGCSNWSPSTSSVGNGVSFQQEATDCNQDQTRLVQPRKKDVRTGKIDDSGSAYSVSRTITVSSTREAVGILENWTDYAPTYTDWVDINILYGCANWSPDPSLYTDTANFTQTSSTCMTDQERHRQDREQETYTQEIRNSGPSVVERRTLENQRATRSYLMNYSEWVDAGSTYDCSAWTPEASTVDSGTSFTQTATCSQNQTRTSAGYMLVNGEWTSDPAVPSRAETQTVTRSSSQNSTGTKAVIECQGPNNSYYAAYIYANVNTSYYQISWAGTKYSIPFQKNTYASVTQNGYTYYNDQIYMGSMKTGTKYQVCKKPA